MFAVCLPFRPALAHTGRGSALMDNTYVIAITVVLGVVGAAVFFLNQPAQAKSRSTSGSMKPRGEGTSNHHVQTTQPWRCVSAPSPCPGRRLAQTMSQRTTKKGTGMRVWLQPCWTDWHRVVVLGVAQ